MSYPLSGVVLNNDDHFSFDGQLQVGVIGEDLFKSLYSRKQNQNRGITYLDVTKNRNYQQQDVDFIVRTPRGKEVTYEVKCDLCNTGNIFIETDVTTIHYRYVNKKRVPVSVTNKNGWLFGSGADRVMYYYAAEGLVFIINRVKFAEWLIQHHVGEKTKVEYDEQGRQLLILEDDGSYPFSSSRKNYGGTYGENRNIEYFGTGYLVPIQDLISSQNLQGVIYVKTIQDVLGISNRVFLSQYTWLKRFADLSRNVHYHWLRSVA